MLECLEEEEVCRPPALDSCSTACMLARLALSMRAERMLAAAHSGSLRQVHADLVRLLWSSRTKGLDLRHVSRKADRLEGFVGAGNMTLKA